MLTLALALALTQSPQHRLFLQPNLPAGASYAFFEAFPSSGAGTTTACSTTAPTGAKGEALTFTRTGSATCTKTATGGLATTGIADGDLVTLSGNVARVEYDSAGVLGLLVESSRTNSALRSQELNNAAWTSFATGVAAPTITADAATAPDGTLTAERFEIPAVTTAQNSIRFQSPVTTSTAVSTCSVYVKGNGSSGTTDVCLQTAAGYTCSACAFVSASWTRCAVTATAGGALQCFIGNAGSLNTPATARSAVDFFAWGFQAETGAYASSYIPTTTASAVRNAEQAEFALTSHTLSAPFSFAATASLPNGLPTNARAHGTVGPSGLATYVDSYLSAGTWVADSTQVTPNAYITAQSTTAGSTVRAATYHDGTNFAGCLNSSCSTVARAWSNLASVVVLRVGQYSSAAGPIDGIQTRVCYQPGDFTRCR